MVIEHHTSDDAVLAHMGQRLAALRLSRQMTQAQLADTAGVSKRTVERLENGESVQMTSFVRCLRALGSLNRIEQMLPEIPVNPILLLERQGKQPQRIRKARTPAAEPWTWADEP